MALENFVPENEAAAMAGVSLRTLMRFAEAGYLQIETEASGRQLFARSEIKEVFGIKDQSEIANDDQEYVPGNFAPASDTAGIAAPAMTEKVIELTLNSMQQAHSFGNGTSAPSTRPVEAGHAQTSQSHFIPRAVALLEQEVSRLRNLNELQEKLLDMREQEVRDLRDQRDWLRGRLENMEEKSKRDQVLLLSEAQTVRQLISINEQRRSPLRATLEWFGLVKPAGTAGLLEAPGAEDPKRD